MASDHEWEREWPTWPEFHVTESDPLGTGAAVCYECPRCGSLVRAPARGKHEVACWGPDTATQTAGQEYPTEYMVTAKASVGCTEKTVSIMVTREFLTDGSHAVRFVTDALDRQITEARQDIG